MTNDGLPHVVALMRRSFLYNITAEIRPAATIRPVILAMVLFRDSLAIAPLLVACESGMHCILELT